METHYPKIIESAVVIFLFVVGRNLFFRLINKTLSDRFFQESRGMIIKKGISLIFLLICAAFLLLIWGVKQSDLAVFIGSVLTVVGVAFFAQWSLLSNVTSSIIIFFNHPVKLNDSIVIMEGKDYAIEGKVTNIGLFFVTLMTQESEEITLPNNIFIQKSIRKVENLSREKPVEDPPTDPSEALSEKEGKGESERPG
jgi:small-conductance mechanosensitive channel